MRLLEETIELAQSEGITDVQVRNLMDHVYSRPAGWRDREIGGVAVCFLAYLRAGGYSLKDVAEVELLRMESIPQEKIDKSVARKRYVGLIFAGENSMTLKPPHKCPACGADCNCDVPEYVEECDHDCFDFGFYDPASDTCRIGD